MKKILFVAAIFLFSMFVYVYNMDSVTASSGFCFLCGSGSSCEQCPSPSGKDTWDDRKACEKKGCKVSGTTSCSTAVNVKKCD
jgi:hypothetical protein